MATRSNHQQETKVAGCFLRFVWIVDDQRHWVLMDTDRNLSPSEMIRIYSLRSKIEVVFTVLTQVIGAFGYRFWTKACPKLSKKQQPKTTWVSGPQQCEKMRSTLRAMESVINFAGIVTSILQYLALVYPRQIWQLHDESS